MTRITIPTSGADGAPVALFTLNGAAVYTGQDVVVSGSGSGTLASADTVARSTADTALQTAWAGTAQANAALQTAWAGTSYFSTEAGTIYVRPDGNDANDGSADTPSAAVATVQKGVTLAANRIGLPTGPFTVKIADGTYAESVVCPAHDGVPINIRGNTTLPANVKIQPPSNNSLLVYGAYTLTGVTLSAPGGHALFAGAGGDVSVVGPLVFRTASGVHIRAIAGATVSVTGTYYVEGGAVNHINAERIASITVTEAKVVLTGTPAFTQFVAASNVAVAFITPTVTWVGAATGARYVAGGNGVINVFNQGANYLPGNTSGSVNTGGQYV